MNAGENVLSDRKPDDRVSAQGIVDLEMRAAHDLFERLEKNKPLIAADWRRRIQAIAPDFDAKALFPSTQQDEFINRYAHVDGYSGWHRAKETLCAYRIADPDYRRFFEEFKMDLIEEINSFSETLLSLLIPDMALNDYFLGGYLGEAPEIDEIGISISSSLPREWPPCNGETDDGIWLWESRQLDGLHGAAVHSGLSTLSDGCSFWLFATWNPECTEP